MANYNINCPHCGTELEVQDEWTGMEMSCPSCQNAFTVPPRPIPVKATSPAAAYDVNCPHCGTKLEVQSEWAGMQMTCPACRNGFVVPGGNAGMAPNVPVIPQTPRVNNIAPQEDQSIDCPYCGSSVKVKKEWVGMDLACPVCQKHFDLSRSPVGVFARTKASAPAFSNGQPKHRKKEQVPAGPLTRYFARWIDQYVAAMVLSFIVIFILSRFSLPDRFLSLLSSIPQWLYYPICLPVILLTDSIIYGTFGGTLGKWLLGIRIVDSWGKKIDGSDYSARNFRVWWSGFGLGLPVISFVAMIIQCVRVWGKNPASYDNSMAFSSIQYESRWYKDMFGIILIIGLPILLVL